MSDNGIINEAILLHRLADGDREAFRSIYDNHRDKLFFYILRLSHSKQLAEDILQEVFIKVWTDRHRLKDVHSFDAWLFTLAKHKIINGFRRVSMEHSILVEMKKSLADQADSTTQTIDYNETSRVLQTVIEQLPPKQKIVYRLRREQGLKNDEIADRLNISPLTVKKHISPGFAGCSNPHAKAGKYTCFHPHCYFQQLSIIFFQIATPFLFAVCLLVIPAKIPGKQTKATV